MASYLESSTSGAKFFTPYLLPLVANFHKSEIFARYVVYLETLQKTNFAIFYFYFPINRATQIDEALLR